jgi:serine/threonine-protein kinase
MAGRLIADRYRLQSVLGRGGMAVVWRADDERLDRPVAIKMLEERGLADPTVGERFDREARAAARLTHPNIVAVFDVGVDDGVPYLVMELIDGHPLDALISGGPMTVDDTVSIAIQVCDALQAAHDAGVVHRDVKPANILVTATGAVKVCDFGIARVARVTQARLTDASVALGTADYMAPEQATGGPIDPRTDLYALGCVLYAMLAGQPPFHGDDALGVMWRHVNQPPAPVKSHNPEVPDALDGLITQLLAKEPADRPGGAPDVRQRLTQISDRPPRGVARAAGAIVPVTVAATQAHPAGPAARAIRAQAAVVTSTRMMPAIEPAAEPVNSAGGFRLGPAGVAAVALSAALVAALAVALLAAGPLARQANPASGPAADSPTPATAPSTATEDGVDAVYAVIQAQIQAGELDDDEVRDLTRRLNDAAEELADGDLDDAARRLADARRELRDLRRRDHVSDDAYDAILASIDEFARSISESAGG